MVVPRGAEGDDGAPAGETGAAATEKVPPKPWFEPDACEDGGGASAAAEKVPPKSCFGACEEGNVAGKRATEGW